MKLYSLYILSAILNFYAIMLMWGVSAGFASYLPIASVISAILLFVIATPLLVFHAKWGAIFGLVLSVVMIPFSVVYIISTIGDSRYHSAISLLFNIPYLLPFAIAGYTGNILIRKNYSSIKFPSAFISKILLSATPLLLFAWYVLSVAKNISFVH